MNLKAVYNYTYFVYPFLVKKERYSDFLGKFLNDGERWSLKLHNTEENISTYAYFLPYVNKFLFPTHYWENDYTAKFEKMDNKRKLAVLSGLTSTQFVYREDLSCKDSCSFDGPGIKFGIGRIELVCFESGICFLIIKTEIDSSKEIYSDDILNFNYRFRTINPRYMKKKKTEGIFLRNSNFGRLEDFSSFIEQLLYGFEDVESESIYFDRLFTYSYMCLDEKEWNDERGLDEIINEFYKFQYVLPGDYGSTFDHDFKGRKDNTYIRWKYSIYGFSRESGVVFSSERERFNSTKLPNYFESMYFYIFLLAFYQRIALILFSQELMTSGTSRIENLKSELTKFTHFSWFSQITNSEQGMDLWKKWQKAFDLPALFDEVQKEYSEFYDFMVARGQERINTLLTFVFVISAVFSGMALLVNFGVINRDNHIIRQLAVAMFSVTVAMYPLYLAFKGLQKIFLEHRHHE